MQSLPLFFNVKNKTVLVVGGGDVALRKVQSLLQAGAQVTVVSPEFHSSLEEIADANLNRVVREYHSSDVEQKQLVIAATDHLTLNKRVKDDCDAANIWVNVVDQPDLCGFTFPSIIDRSPLVIAISTNGKAPVLGRLLKEKLEKIIPRWTGQFAKLAGEFRAQAKQQINDFKSRRHFWERVFRGKASQYAAGEQWDLANKEMQNELSAAALGTKTANSDGQVFLVGGGPGDPDLLTIKALQVMQLADVIVYDYLIADDILRLCRKDADMISVGKKAGEHTLPQEKINQLLVDLAKEGKVVCRLKGGDPYIFGRGGEEAQLLVENNIPFNVIPGITAASACSASTGIPLTHRDYSQSVQFITGHFKSAEQKSASDKTPGKANQPNWTALAASNQTLVIYMGIIRSSNVKDNLIKHGRAASTPVAIIENGTRPNQRVVTGTLEHLDTLADEHNIGSPALIIVGEVVDLHKTLSAANLDSSFYLSEPQL